MKMKKESIDIAVSVLTEKIAVMESQVKLEQYADDMKIIACFNPEIKKINGYNFSTALENVPSDFQTIISQHMGPVMEVIQNMQRFYAALDDFLQFSDKPDDVDSGTTSSNEGELKHTEEKKSVKEEKPTETPAKTKSKQEPSSLSKRIPFESKYDWKIEQKYLAEIFDENGNLKFKGLPTMKYQRERFRSMLKVRTTGESVRFVRNNRCDEIWYWECFDEKRNRIKVPIPTVFWGQIFKDEIENWKTSGDYERMRSKFCEVITEYLNNLKAEPIQLPLPKVADEPKVVETKKTETVTEKKPEVTVTKKSEPVPTTEDEKFVPFDWDPAVDKTRYMISSLGYVFDTVTKEKLTAPTVGLMRKDSGRRLIYLRKLIYTAFNPKFRSVGYITIGFRDGNSNNCRIDNLVKQ